MEKLDDVREVKSLREVPRVPECCGKPMRKFQGVSPSTGKVVTSYNCERCGKQERKYDREPVK